MKSEQTLLQEGDVIRLKIGHKVYADIPKHFAYANKKGDFSICNAEAVIEGELSYLSGEYVVTKTVLGGGSQRQGYPDGHRVYCKKINGDHKVNFYQTGCFTAMIKDIAPIGKAELKWSYNASA